VSAFSIDLSWLVFRSASWFMVSSMVRIKFSRPRCFAALHLGGCLVYFLQIGPVVLELVVEFLELG
jgi:hypothetical protein